MHRFSLITLAASAHLLIFVDLGVAQFCSEAIDDPKLNLNRASAVFVGTVTGKDKPVEKINFSKNNRKFVERKREYIRYSFSVEKVFKGKVGNTVDVIVGETDDVFLRKQYPFEKKVQYLVFASLHNGGSRFITSACSGTKPAANAASEIKLLGTELAK